MDFGPTLKLLRVDAGLSLRALARRVGVSSAYLSRVESGRDPAPTPDRLEAIAAALQLPSEVLVELAHQTGPALADYLERVPHASAFFLEVARRELDAAQLARLRDVMDAEFPEASSNPAPAAGSLSALVGARIVLGLTCSEFSAVITAGSALLGGSDPRRTAELAQLIFDREAMSPTAIGNGVAVPHAVVPGARTAAALVTPAEPISYGNPGADPIALAFVLVSSEPGRPHLETLAHIARLASRGVATQLAAARTHAEAVAAIARIDATWPS